MLLSGQNQNVQKVSFSWFMGQLCESITSIMLAPWENAIFLPIQKHTNYHLELGNSVHCITAEGLSEWCYCPSEGTNRVNSLWGGGSCASISHLYCIFLSSLRTPQIHLPSEGDSCKCGIWCALPAFPPSLDNLSERDWCKPFAQPQTLQGHHMGGLDKTLWYFYSFIPNQLTVNP